MFKIRHKITGMFSSGGAYPKWSRKGKTWSSYGHVMQHLRPHMEKIRRGRHLSEAERDYALGNIEIVEYTMSEVGVVPTKE